MDRQSVYTLSLFGEEQSANGDSTNRQTQKELVAFVLEFHLDGNYIYRYAQRECERTRTALTACSDQIRENVLSKQYYCDIDIAHLIAFNEELANRLNNEPADIIPIVRGAARSMLEKD